MVVYQNVAIHESLLIFVKNHKEPSQTDHVTRRSFDLLVSFSSVPLTQGFFHPLRSESVSFGAEREPQTDHETRRSFDLLFFCGNNITLCTFLLYKQRIIRIGRIISCPMITSHTQPSIIRLIRIIRCLKTPSVPTDKDLSSPAYSTHSSVVLGACRGKALMRRRAAPMGMSSI